MRNKLIISGITFILMLLFAYSISFAQTPTEVCKGGVCDTAIGQINATSTVGIIEIIFRNVVAIAGVSAVILLLIGGYRIMMSKGDKEKLQNARETITSAVLGLVFIVLSLVILQIIGVDILHIPLFTATK